MFLYAFNVATTQAYPLFYSVILNSGITLHIFNDLAHFYNLRKAPRDHYIVAGNSQVPILAYGDVNVTIKGRNSPQTLRLREVAYYSGF